jgi:cob(I)alamin adenosyltransferase
MIQETDIKWMEDVIDKYEAELKPLTHFIIPGGCESSALLNISRTVCRRAERRIVELKRKEEIERELTKYINRLSDLLFVLSRVENKRQGISDTIWKADG